MLLVLMLTLLVLALAAVPAATGNHDGRREDRTSRWKGWRKLSIAADGGVQTPKTKGVRLLLPLVWAESGGDIVVDTSWATRSCRRTRGKLLALLAVVVLAAAVPRATRTRGDHDRRRDEPRIYLTLVLECLMRVWARRRRRRKRSWLGNRVRAVVTLPSSACRDLDLLLPLWHPSAHQEPP
ncbi:hypothetical protein C8R45DRAFT_1044969 [Mycena sanguinolenta]|nr:hypothetical protein C8R45DRAFT_1044969 [Mycena sanguinolenta]